MRAYLINKNLRVLQILINHYVLKKIERETLRQKQLNALAAIAIEENYWIGEGVAKESDSYKGISNDKVVVSTVFKRSQSIT